MNAERRDIAAILVELVGMEDAKTLMGAPGVGGRTLTFSRGKRDDGIETYQLVAGILNEEKARILADYFDGEPVYVPRLSARLARMLVEQNHRKIRQRCDELLRMNISSRRAIAILVEETELSDRQLWTITGRADPQEDDRQTGLF